MPTPLSNLKQTKSEDILFLKDDPPYSTEINSYDTEEYTKCFSTCDENDEQVQEIFGRDPLHFTDIETCVIEMSKKQNVIANYSNFQALGYGSRNRVMVWVEKILNSITLSQQEKFSIFFRFNELYDMLLDKLTSQGKTIENFDELKKLIIVCFLIAYKFEGYCIAKIKLSSLVEAFLSNVPCEGSSLEEDLQILEMKLLKLLDYNIMSIDSNIFSFTNIFCELLKRRNIFQKDKDFVHFKELTDKFNKMIVTSEKTIFNTSSLDKAVISIFSALFFMKSETWNNRSSYKRNYVNHFKYVMLSKAIAEFYEYLSKKLKILKMNMNTLQKMSLFLSSQMRI